jgi:hypothetical protein
VGVGVRACVRVCVRVCVCACVRACARAHARAFQGKGAFACSYNSFTCTVSCKNSVYSCPVIICEYYHTAEKAGEPDSDVLDQELQL